MCQSFIGSLLNHLFHYTNEKISVKLLFNLHYLSLFQLPLTRSKFVQFMEYLAVITALNRYCSFGKHFVQLKKKKKKKKTFSSSVFIGKNCALCLQYRYSRLCNWAYILRCVMFKRTCIHSLTSVNTTCNLWREKIPLARLSQSQRARQRLFFQLQAMQKRGKFSSDHFFSDAYISVFFMGITFNK